MAKPIQACRGECPYLAQGVDTERSSAPIPRDHFACAWRAAAPSVTRRVRRALRSLSLGRLWLRMEDRCRGVVRPSAPLVREAMSRDAGVVEELVQDVALALWEAVARGAVRGAYAALEGWCAVVVPRIVRRRARAAVIVCASADPRASGADDPRYVEPAVAPLVFGAANDNGRSTPDARLEYRALVSERPMLIGRLTPLERDAFEAWLDGQDPAEIARAQDATPVCIRLRLLRARRRIATDDRPGGETDGTSPHGTKHE